MGMPKKDPGTKMKEMVGRRQQEFASKLEAFDKSRKERTGEKVITKILSEVAQVSPNPNKLTAAEFPATVLAQIRQCVQLLAHEEDKYQVTSITVLSEIMMRYPVLVDCVVNNILRVYHKPKKLYQRQAKLLGIGCVFRYGLRHVGIRMMQRLIAEIVLVRYSSNKDDMEIFFLITALQEESKVAVISHLVVEGMSGDLARPINTMKPTTLWLRVVLAERMMALGLQLPVWLHDTFLPKQVDAFGEVLIPKSQKLAPNHPMFANFIDLLANYYRLRTKLQKSLGLQPIPNPVLVFFKDRIAPSIINCYRLAGKKTSFELAYRLFMSILTSKLLDLDTVERVVQWSVAGEGLNFFLTMDKKPLKDALCRLILSFDNFENEYERSRLALCVLQGSLVVPKLRHIAQERLKELNTEHAHNCVNNAVNSHWAQRLSVRESGLMLKLVTLPQCRGEDNKMWRQQVAEGLSKRAMRFEDSMKRRHLYEDQMSNFSITDQNKGEGTEKENTEKSDENAEGDKSEEGEQKSGENGEQKSGENGEQKSSENGDIAEENENKEGELEQPPWEATQQPKFEEKPIMSKGNMRAFYSKDLDSKRLFFRFLVHASNDHDTIFPVLISSFNSAYEEINKDPAFLRLDWERYDSVKKLAQYMQLLYKGTPKSARLRMLLQVIVSQLGLELMLKCSRDTEEIVLDFIPCLQQYLDEEGLAEAAVQEEQAGQMLQDYDEKIKELQKEEQRIRRRKKRERQRKEGENEEEEDPNMIAIPGQEAMPKFEDKDIEDENMSDKEDDMSDDEEQEDLDDEGDDGNKVLDKGCGDQANEEEVLEDEDGVLQPVEGECKWLGVLMDVLIALCTRGESWWRVALKPTAFLLAGRMTSELLAGVTEVLFNEKLVAPSKGNSGDKDNEEESEEEEDEENDDDTEDATDSCKKKDMKKDSEKKKSKQVKFECEQEQQEDEEEESDDSEVEEEEEDREGMEVDDEVAEDEDEEEEEDEDESEDGDSGNESDDKESGDEEEDDGLDPSVKQSKLDEMKGALFQVLGPSGPDDAVEEDMDKVPPEELRALNIQLGAVLGSYMKKKSINNPNALTGVSADIVQFRNRVLDMVEGLIDGPLPCELLLSELLVPLLETMALHTEQRMADLTNRIRKAVQHIREKKKYINVGDMTIEKFENCLKNMFEIAKDVPETKHGFVTLIRCSEHFCREKNIAVNPVVQSYISHARKFIRDPAADAMMLLEPLHLEILELRSGLCRALVEEIFSPPIQEEEADDFKSKARRIFEKKKEYPNLYPVMDGKMTTVWLFLESLFSHILPKASGLTEDEKWAVTEVIVHINEYTDVCKQPKLRDVAIINFVLKILVRYDCSGVCVDWNALCDRLVQYRRSTSYALKNFKGVKMELKKLLDTSLRSGCKSAVSVLKDRKANKQKRKDIRKAKNAALWEKQQKKKAEKTDATKNPAPKINEGVTESLDDLFKPNSKHIDEDDPELDLDERAPKKRKLEEEAEADILRKAKEIRSAKTALNRKKRQRMKVSKKGKKEALAQLKEMEKQRIENLKKDQGDNNTKENKSNINGKKISPSTLNKSKCNSSDKNLMKINKKSMAIKSKKADKQSGEIKKVKDKVLIKNIRMKTQAALDAGANLQSGIFKFGNSSNMDE